MGRVKQRQFLKRLYETRKGQLRRDFPPLARSCGPLTRLRSVLETGLDLPQGRVGVTNVFTQSIE